MTSAAAWEPVIGLEIHVQLATRTKMFCGCELSFGEPPNTRTCPVCLGLPGTLPVTNAQAIHFGLMMGLALGCEIAPRSIFHRKNYFYPDLAKGYQISQYDIPLCLGGHLGDVRIHRIHLEEDAAKLVHVATFASVIPLALVGMVMARRRWRELLPLYLLVACHAVMVLIFYGTPRFTVIIMPALLVFACVPLLEIAAKLGAASHPQNRAQTLRHGI